MTEIVIAIAAKVAEALVEPTIRQGQYLFCVNKVIKNLDNEKEELKVERDSIQDRKEQAEKRTEKVVDSVDKWLNDVRNLLDEVEQLEQDVKERHCVQGWCPTWRRYRFCKEMAKKTKAITDLKAKSNFETFSRLASLPGIEYISSQNFTYFESTKAAYNQLLEALQDDNVYMIGLYGMGGSGKTTLATEVGKKALELKLFEQVIPITVSQAQNIRSIQGEMADMVNLTLQEESEKGRAQRLWLRLKEEKRVLIIVDDVWAKFNLEQIGIRLDDNKKLNFKVLLTTRRRGICELMDCQRQIFLKHLSDSDAWRLFQNHAGIGDGSSSNLLEVAREVSNECKGLPIAIKAVGSSLKGKGDNEWKVALERLRNPEQFDDNGEEGFTDAFTCLKLSYDYLRNKEAEMLFLMCSMFPEDHEILIEDLVRYGVGLGLCRNFSSFDLARSCIRAGIDKLMDSCLLLHYKERKHHGKREHHVKMHDVVRDVALQIASRSEDHKILVNVSKDLNSLAENGAIKDYFAISSWYKETYLISYQLDAPKLEILLLKTENKNSLDFSFASSEGVKELKVMSLLNSSYYYPQSSLLPQSTQWLTNLRTLRLSGWNLGDLSFLVNLTKLEILDLRWCHLKELPKGMGKLNKLKLLDLSNCEISESLNYEAIVTCLHLEELYAIGYNQGCPTQCIEDIVGPPNLRRFVIRSGRFRTIDYEECTRVLSLHDFNISDIGASKQNLLQRAEDIRLERLHGVCKNVIPDMVRVMGGMNELTNLYFRSCSEMECLIDTTYGSFQVDTSLPKLVKLELSEMVNLKELCRGPPWLVPGFFEKLEKLFIRKCQQLHSIFPEACNLCNLKILKIGNYDNFEHDYGHNNCTAVVSLFSMYVARSLQQLEELSIEGCKELKHIITSEGEGGTNTGDNSQLMFPNLKKLLVSFCPKLEFIFPISFAIQSLLQLQEIQISNASGLKYVFGQYDHEAHSSHENQVQIMLPSLNVFKLYDLENLLGTCPENYHLRYPSLVKLSCWGCPKLSTCSNVIVSSTQISQRLNKGVALDEDQPNHLTLNLQRLELYKLPQLKLIWSSSPPKQVLSFQFLQLLNLDGCANLKSVFSMAIGRSLPELTSLSIYHCEELEEIMVETEEPQNLSNTEVCFPKLSELVIKKCNKLKSLFSIAMVGMSPQLSTLHISEAAQLEMVFRYSKYNTDNKDQMLLPSLEKLELEKLPSFVNIFQEFNFQLAPKLQDISAHECPKFGPILRGTQGIFLLHTEVEQLEQDVKANRCFQEWCPTRGRYGIEYSSSQNFTYFESRKVAYDQLLEALKDDNAYMIGLYGMGGSGKTTLATEVGEKAKSELKLFDQVISVTVSQTPNIRSIQGKIANMLNSKLQEEYEEGRVRRLWLRPREAKRVLIIVDDVWAKLDLKEIGIRLDDNNKLNFKVLLTTRQRKVCVSMGCQKDILLDLLSESEGWSLFQKHAGIGDRSSSNLLEVARKVSDECKGLPIAIKAVGSSLKGKGDDEWKVALKRLRNPEQLDDNGEEGFTDAFTCLKLSYDYLRNKEAEMLFLMCSMFPEDHEILIEDLVRYGVGLGLCRNFSSFDLARSSIRAGIDKLMDSCLLLHYGERKHSGKRERHVKMHVVVRDVALQIASRSEDRKILVNLANDLNDLADNGNIKDYFGISSWYLKTNIVSYQLDAPKLEIFLLENQTENSLDFSFASSEGVKELNVISILNSYYSPQSLLLHQSTQWLTNLRTLSLRRWKLGDLSFLTSLTRLEALDLRFCRIKELPKGMEELNKLKLLDLSDCALPKNFNYEALGSFSQLEELYVDSWGFPSEVIKDIVTLSNLQRFRISETFDFIDYGESTRVLGLHDFNISDFSASKQNLVQRAEHVSLQGLHGGCKNVIPNMVQVMGTMNELTDLCFHSCLEIERLIDTTLRHAGSFQVDTFLPKLVKLELSEMDNLKELCRGPPLLVPSFFEKLEQLFIRNCQQLCSIFPETCKLCNLKILKIGNYGNIGYNWDYYTCATVVSLFSVYVAQSLKQLEELSIEGCKELKHIIISDGEGGTNTGDNSQSMFPKLKKLLVSFCPKLEYIFPISFALQGLLQLQEIKISDASGIKYVFFHHDHEAHSSHENQVQIMLPSLNVFKLYDLENLLGICPENYHLRYSSLVKLRCSGCPKLINVTVNSKQKY